MPPKSLAHKSKKPRIQGPPLSSSSKPAAADSGSILTSADKLRWKKVARPSQAVSGSLDHEGGILELEEVDDVEVVYVDLPGGGRKVMFKAKAPAPDAEQEPEEEEEELVASGSMLDEDEAAERKAALEQMGSDEEMDEGGVGLDEEEYEPWGGIQEDGEDQSEAGPSTSGSLLEPVPVLLTKKEKKERARKAREEKARLEGEKPEGAESSEETAMEVELATEQDSVGEPAVTTTVVDDSFDETLLPHWSKLDLHPLLKRAIFKLGFFKPSPIQSASLPAGLTGRDIVGVAETGSGKTLSYGLPILSHCLSLPPPPAPLSNTTQANQPKHKRELQALILAPTRELALQVSQHLQKAVEATTASLEAEDLSTGGKKEEAGGAGKNAPPRVSVGAIVGGMSAQKQKRVLERGVDILVATPGRLWDLIGENESIAHSIRHIKYLVIDEADRMIETGHFLELESIVALTHRNSSSHANPSSLTSLPLEAPKKGSKLAEDLAFEEEVEEGKAREAMQTFVFSATLSKELQRNLQKFSGKPRAGGKRKGTTLEDLFEKLDFRDAQPEVIDLSPKDGVVSTLQESKIECMVNEKDLYLYYFLLRYPGRSLIFFGSIDGIRRAVPLLELLKFPIFPLHSQLQQKQRLKNLDRFKSTPNGILLATDIAARGLDIPSVDHVIHYQLPRSADTYVHRSGRTARAKMVGFSLQLCGPEEKRVQRALMKSLGRDDELPELPIEHGMLDKLKKRIQVARQIDSANHKVKKDNHEKSWVKEAAEALELDMEDEDVTDNEDGSRSQKNTNDRKVAILKAELRALLAEPLVARGISQKYITSGSRKIVDALLAGSQHSTMMGMETTTAAHDASTGKSKKRKAPAAPLAEDDA